MGASAVQEQYDYAAGTGSACHGGSEVGGGSVYDTT